MKSRPIIFSGPMVRATLDGSKTQTRRVVEPMRGEQSKWCGRSYLNDVPSMEMCYTNPDKHYGAQMEHPRGGPGGWIKCPYGVPGDQTWLREAYRLDKSLDNHRPSQVTSLSPLLYLADNTMAGVIFPGQTIQDVEGDFTPGRYRLARFMCRWMSRADLSVTNVRVERVQDISEEDAKAEGIYPDSEYLNGRTVYRNGSGQHYTTARGSFERPWNSINGKKPGCSWESNPWVWVVEFRRIK